MLNEVKLIGRVGKDPELKKTNSGTSIASTSLATTEKYKNKNGERQENTSWHNLTIYGKGAEIFTQFVAKGSLVYVSGKINYQQWDDRDGNKKYRTEIVVNDFKFLDSKKSNNNQQGGQQQQPQQGGYQQQPQGDDGYGQNNFNEDDLPF